MVAGIVLAAGSSTRMGRNKLLLRIGGETLVRRTVRTAAEAGLDAVMVVSGHAREQVEREVRDLGCTTVFNPAHGDGIRTSTAAGVKAVRDTATAAVVMLADMPFVTATMVYTLVERYRAEAPLLVASRYGGRINAPPILYDRALFPELVRRRAGCGREVVRRHLGRALQVEWPTDRLRDLDRPRDYEQARTEFACSPRNAKPSGSEHAPS